MSYLSSFVGLIDSIVTLVVSSEIGLVFAGFSLLLAVILSFRRLLS